MKGLILFDWDKTIVDSQSYMNDPKFEEKVKKMTDQGWIIGLNSDTPLKRLKIWREALGMNGPIIAEKGAVVWWPNLENPKFTIPKTVDIFLTIQKNIISELIQQKNFEKYALFFGDSTQFINSVNQVKGNDLVIVAIDAYRECSIGLFIRRITSDGNLDNPLAKEDYVKKIDKLLRTTCKNYLQDFTLYFNDEYYFRGIYAKDAKKSLGMNLLLKEWQYPKKIYMIGDSMPDYLELSSVNQLAVGNADAAYKKQVENIERKNIAQGYKRIAKKKFTQGCTELLFSIEAEN